MGNIYSAAKVKHANTRRNRQFYATVNPIGGNQFAQQTEREWMPSDGKLISSAVLACWFPVIPFLHECVCVWQDNCVFIWNFRYISLNGSVDFRLFCATIWFFPPWKAFDCFLLSYYSIAFVMGAELNSLLQQWLLPLCSFNKRVFIKQAFHTQCYGKCQLINSINSLACRT